MHSGRVNQNDLSFQVSLRFCNMKDSQNAVARGLRFGAYDGQFLTHQRVQQGGFSGIRTTENADESRMKGHGACCLSASMEIVALLASRHLDSRSGRKWVHVNPTCRGCALETRTRSTRRS